MRKTLLIAAAGTLAFGLALGCARQTAEPSATPPPTMEELPRFTFTERIIPARVGVEGRDARSIELLVPSYAPPPLTPEEQAALAFLEGREKPLFNWLEFYVPAPRVVMVTPDFGGARVGSSEAGGVQVGFDCASTTVGIGFVRTGVEGVHYESDVRASGGGPVTSRAGRSGQGGTRVGVDVARHAAGHATQVDD